MLTVKKTEIHQQAPKIEVMSVVQGRTPTQLRLFAGGDDSSGATTGA